METRYVTLIGIILAVIAGVIQLVGQMAPAVPFLVIPAIILIGIGSLTGR